VESSAAKKGGAVSEARSSGILSIFIGLSLAGCAAVEVGWDVDKGRRYLMMGEPQLALVEFEQIEQLEPEYNITGYEDYSLE
jgi:hypothetical protein